MNTRLVNTAADVILRALTQNRTAAGIALALESAQLLQSPGTAAEHEKLRARVEELLAQRDDLLVESVTAPDTDDLQQELRHYKEKSTELEAALYTEQAHGRTLLEQRNAHAQELLKLRPRVAELEAAAIEGRSVLAAFCHDLEDPGSNAFSALYLLQQATPGIPMERGETVPKVYRASHDSIVMGLYTTATEARAHCVAEERRSWAKGQTVVFDWIEDEEDGVAELVTVNEDGETESVTGYVVTALEIAAKYDPDGDE
jgi:hypothetical protein